MVCEWAFYLPGENYHLAEEHHLQCDEDLELMRSCWGNGTEWAL